MANEIEIRMAKKSITQNYIYNLIYQILILVLPIITTPYISRILGATNVGIYSYTYSIVSYFILFASLGVALYGQREIAYAGKDTSKRNKLFWEIAIFRIISVLIVFCIYIIFCIKSQEYKIYYFIWGLELLATALDIGWFFQGMEEFKKTVLRNVIVRIASITLIFLLVKNESDLIKYITIYSIADFVGNLSLWFYLPKYLKGIKIKRIEVLSHVIPIILLFIPQIASQVYNMLDKTMIGRIIVDKAEVGYYEEAQKVIKVLITIVSSLGVVMVPRMASVFASGEKDKVKEYLKKSFKFAFLLAFPMVFGVIIIADAFVPVFFGAGFEKTIILIKILAPSVLLFGLASVIGYQYLLPTKRQKEYTLSILAGLIINFVLNYILIKLMASEGASISTLISELIVLLIQIFLIRNEITILEIMKIGEKYFIYSLMMFVACWIIKLILGTTLIAMAVQIIVGMGIYFICLLVTKDEFLERIQLIIKSKLKGEK